MAVTSNTFTGDGSTTNYSFTFEYLEQNEVKVTLDGTATTAFTFANATTLSFTSAPASGVEIRIYRDTNVDTLPATFFAGSAIKAEDLNDNFTQNNFAVQEIKNNTWDVDTQTIKSNETWVSNDTQIATTAAMDARFQDEAAETITSSETWPDDDNTIATTAAIDNRIDTAITNDIAGSDGVSITDDGDGTITIGLTDSAVDLDKIKDDDKITYAEQNAGSPSPSDSNIFTASAAARRFDGIVQTSTPSGSDWETGKLWLQNDNDKTLHMWNGSMWLPLVSGGSFTKLSKVIYVDSINGDDTLDGHRISNPKKTIKAAVDDINSDPDGDGSLVIVAPGIYGETFPIDIEKNDVGIVGTALRNCIIHPAIPAADQAGYDVNVPEANELTTMFRVNSGSYFYGLTLTGMKASGTRGGYSLDTDSTYGLPTNQGWNFAFYPNAQIKKSPYIQNCTNFSDSRVNNVNFTPHTPGEGAAGDLTSSPTGGGILVNGATVASNSPLRSMVADSYTHTALDGPGIFVTNNGYTQITSSYAFFNHYHIKCLNGGQANLAASTSDFGRYGLLVDGRSTSAIFTATTTANAADGAITFTIGAPTAAASWHGSATRPQGNMLVDIGGNTYPILSATANGSGWDVTISRPDPTKRDRNLGLDGAVSSGAAVSFYLRSMIASSGHTMEYVGSGTDYRALPENGGVPVEANQVVELNNGKVWTATTDHNGKFKVGDFFTVDQRTGFVTVPVGSISFPTLAEDLNVNGHEITSASNGDVVINPDGTGDIVLDADVGIGVSNPLRPLHVSGSSSAIAQLTTTSIACYQAFENTNSTATNAVQLGAVGTNEFAIHTGGTGEKLRIDSSGNVGIGTSSPSAALEVSRNTGNSDVRITTEADNTAARGSELFFSFSDGDGARIQALRSTGATASDVDLKFSVGGGNNAAEKMRITSTGNVGIGTSSPNVNLQVSGAGSTLAIDDTANSAPMLRYRDNGTTIGRIYMSSGDMRFDTDGTTERVRIKSNGNVGIGTSSPDEKLHISAGANSAIRLGTAGGDYAYRLRANVTSSVNGGFLIEDAVSGNDLYKVVSGSSGSHNFFINNSEKVRIDSSGNVGIGTSSPNTNLEVAATKTISNVDSLGQLVVKTTSGSTGNMLNIGVDETNSRSFIQSLTRGTSTRDLLLNPYGGNVGIGTSSPQGDLHVGSALTYVDTGASSIFANSGSHQRVVIAGGSSSVKDIQFRDTSDTANKGIIRYDGNDDMRFYTNANERFRIDSSGKVGIGTSSPAEKLQVGGNISCQELYVTSNGDTAGSGISGRFAHAGINSKSLVIGADPDNIGTLTRLQFNVDGTERLRIDSSGRVGIGTSSPATVLHTYSAALNTGITCESATSESYIKFVDPNGAAYVGNSGNNIRFLTGSGAAERARIDGSGRLLVGTSSSVSQGGFTPALQQHSTGASGTGIYRWSNNTGSPVIGLGKSRGAAPGTNAIVQDGDALGALVFSGDDGTDLNTQGASITANVDGTPGSNDMPGRLVFSTTNTGDSSPSERLRIDDQGQTFLVTEDDCLEVATIQGSGTSKYLLQGRYGATVGTPSTGTISFKVFSNGNVQNTNNSYGAISDAKLKENIVDASSQWDDIKDIRIRNYNFIEGQTHTQIGVVAQEVELVSPGLVTESPDLDDDGNDLGTTTKSVNYSVLYMKSVKALQEAMERIETLEAKVAALEAG